MTDLRLTAFAQGTNCTDLDLTNGKATLVSGAEEIAQRIRITLQTQLGESVYDRSGGTPYLEVLMAPGTTELAMRATVETVLLNVTGVSRVDELTVTIADRVASISGNVTSTAGDTVTFGTQVTA
jgi:phage baseplate assembly protein W